MKRTVLYIISGAVLIALAVGAVVWRSQVAMSQGEEEETRSAVVERGDLLVAVLASGNIEPQAQVGLAFDVPGRVVEVPVEEGDAVRAGDLLAWLDTGQLELQVSQAQAVLTSAEARLAQLEAGARPEEIEAAEASLRAAQAQVSAASADLDRLRAGASDGEIAAAEADLASAMTQEKSARDAHDMTLKCFTFTYFGQEHEICPALGAPEVQTRYNLWAAEKGLVASQARLDELLAGADADAVRAAQANVEAATAQQDAAQAQLDLLLAGATEEQIAASEVQVAQAQVALEQAELSLERTSLYASLDGVVAAVNVTAGEMAPTGLPAVVLLDTSRFRLVVSVDEIDVGRLVVGQAVEVTVDALPEVDLAGTVERIAPAATLEGGVVYYEIVIRLAPADTPIRADMTANAIIVVEELSDVLTIPTWVVRVDRSTGETYVHRQVAQVGQEGEEVERVEVALGVRHEGVAQVLSGLSEGDVVVWVEQTGFEFGHP